MAQSLFEKARTAVLGNLHKLLDKAANTPEGYAQHIRDLEEALADLRAAGDEAAGTANGYRRDITNVEGEKAQKQADIDLLLGDDDESNDEAALRMQMDLEDLDGRLATLGGLLAEAESNKADLDGAIDKLEAKHREMVSGLQELTLKSAASKAKNRAASAAEAAAEASDAADGASIDSIAQKIEHDNDVADARFDRVIGQLQGDSSPEEAARLARAKAALAARRAKIAAEATKPQESVST